MIRYTTGIIEPNMKESKEIDIRATKMMTMVGVFRQKQNSEWFCLLKKRMISDEDCVSMD